MLRLDSCRPEITTTDGRTLARGNQHLECVSLSHLNHKTALRLRRNGGAIAAAVAGWAAALDWPVCLRRGRALM